MQLEANCWIILVWQDCEGFRDENIWFSEQSFSNVIVKKWSVGPVKSEGVSGRWVRESALKKKQKLQVIICERHFDKHLFSDLGVGSISGSFLYPYFYIYMIKY